MRCYRLQRFSIRGVFRCSSFATLLIVPFLSGERSKRRTVSTVVCKKWNMLTHSPPTSSRLILDQWNLLESHGHLFDVLLSHRTRSCLWGLVHADQSHTRFIPVSLFTNDEKLQLYLLDPLVSVPQVRCSILPLMIKNFKCRRLSSVLHSDWW